MTHASRRLALPVALALASCALATACGYHLSGKGGNLPAHIKKIAVPELENTTTRPELGQRATEQVVKELASRGKYQLSADETGADAVLEGTILSWNQRSLLLTREQSDAQRVSVTLKASVVFTDRTQGRVLWKQDSYTFTQEYDVIGDPEEYFDTELDAVDRVAKDFARAVVSAILQGF